MRMVNLTPHRVSIYLQDGSVVVLEPAGPVPRVRQEEREVGLIEVGASTVPVIKQVYSSKIEDLPEPEQGVRYIVSALTAQAARGSRDDLLVPARPVRDEQGRIIGCRALARIG